MNIKKVNEKNKGDYIMLKNDLYEKADKVENVLGTENLLVELEKALSSDELKECLEFIERMHDLDI